MRFTAREGTDPIASIDATMLAAMGLPGGGVVSVGNSHVLARPSEMEESTAIGLGPIAMANTGMATGQVTEVKRAVLPHAQRIVVSGGEIDASVSEIMSALQGVPVTTGDTLVVDPSYLSDRTEPMIFEVVAMKPAKPATIGVATVIVAADPEESYEAPTRYSRSSQSRYPTTNRPAPKRRTEFRETTPTNSKSKSEEDFGEAPSEMGPPIDPAPATSKTTGPTHRDALLAGLDDQLDLLTGWVSLLTKPGNLPSAWGLPQVAGLVLEGPTGCGKAELIQAAADNAGTRVHSVNLDLVFKPERLLDLLEKAVKTTTAPVVIFVDRLEAVAGEEGMSPMRTQVAAIIRWFLDAVAEKPGVACVLGVSDASHLDDSIMGSPLLPRTLTVPPPDLQRRRLLFQAALAKVPSGEIDHEQLAARSAGFSGSDILASVVHASAVVARSGKPLEMPAMITAVEETTPSLGSASLGEIPSYGFERVAGLVDVKQRLTEAVIWPMTQPERFTQLGIEPPRGILLYGPPGTGKTFVIRALAHEAGAAFFPVKGAELLDKFVGESERGIREVFARARSAAPSILFFDEFDALAPIRGSSSTSVTDSVVATLLTEIDGFGGRGDVVVIGATNRRDLIDPALLRSGRFEVHVELGLPEEAGRRALLDIVDVPFADDVSLDQLAKDTEGLSFADITGLLREAALSTLRSDVKALEVNAAQIETALEMFRAR